MPGKHFFPRAQDAFVQWSVVFNNYIAAHAQELQLSPEQVNEYNQKHTAMMVAVASALNPSTRGPSQTRAKNSAIAAVRKTARELARQIRARVDVTPEQRHNMGLAQRNPGGRHPRSKQPATAPRIWISVLGGDQLEVHLRDCESTGRARPRGVFGAILCMHIGDHPPEDIRAWRSAGTVTRTKHPLTLPKDAKPGMIVWVTACWLSTRGEPGPYAEPAHTMAPLALGGIAARIGYVPKETANANAA